MKNTINKYSVPVLEIQDLEVERGFALSYGDEGGAGQTSSYNDLDTDL